MSLLPIFLNSVKKISLHAIIKGIILLSKNLASGAGCISKLTVPLRKAHFVLRSLHTYAVQLLY